MTSPTATPRGMRLHIGFFGRRNVGKSSLLNALTRQNVSIVSPVPGTTTDPVEKAMEFQPLGPVQFIDTAGLDDDGDLGPQRIERSRRALDRCDIPVLVAESGDWGDFENASLADMLAAGKRPLVVFNKNDLRPPDPALLENLKERKVAWVATSVTDGRGVSDLRQGLIRLAPEDFINAPPLLRDLVPAGETAILVVPIDREAPKGRIILPQVQAIRDLLDGDSMAMVVKETGLTAALTTLGRPPALVVTDSQAFRQVSRETPESVPMTSFSILFARFKGDLPMFIEGTRAVSKLRPGDHVLIAEACTHHPIEDDIGRVKLPRWLNEFVGGELRFTTLSGHDFPEDLSGFSLAILCGACMQNRREVLSRLERCRAAGVPVTNYGLCIAYSFGIFDRAIRPFVSP